MNFLEPLGLLSLAALAPVIALYFLKLKREERVVPSTLLWKKLLDDLQVNSPFQRLKYSLLLLLQLLLVALLGFALARPYLSLAAFGGQKIILLLDTSASMATLDAGPDGKESRFTAALHDALTKVDDLRSSDEMAVVAFDKEVRQLSKFTSDRQRLKQILAALRPRDMETNAAEAFETALALSEGHKNVQVLVLSDGCFGPVRMLPDQNETVRGNLEDKAIANAGKPAQARLSNFRFVSYGSESSDNVAITQIDARTRPIQAIGADGKRFDTQETQLFVMVENFSPQPREVVLSLSTEGQRFSPKVVSLKGRESANPDAARSEEVFKLPPGATGAVTAHIESPKDKLAADDTASVVINPGEGIRLLLVSKGNYFLEKALHALKAVAITAQAPDDFNKAWEQKGAQATEDYDVCVFDETAPLNWTDGGALFIGAKPPLPGFVKLEKTLEWPAVVDWDVAHPIMRYVNFGTLTVAKAQAWSVPKNARVIVESGGGPLLAAFENDRLRAVGIAFDIFSSDWAYHPALPLFFRNAIPWLAEASPRKRPASQHTGTPLVVPPGLGAGKAQLFRPGGGPPEEVQLSAEHSTFIKGAETAGLYRLRGYAGKDSERVYAVNLCSRSESDNAARPSLKVDELTFFSAPTAVAAKHEIWRALTAVALVFLLLEWLVFHRRVGM